MESGKTLEVWLSECLVSDSPEPLFREGSAVDTNTNHRRIFFSGTQVYALYYREISWKERYANICFDGLREWWFKNIDAVDPAERSDLAATIGWRPLRWEAVPDTLTEIPVWEMYRPDENSRLSPYDVLTIPMDTLIGAIKEGNSVNISLWNTDSLTVIVRPRLADKYHPYLEVLLD